MSLPEGEGLERFLSKAPLFLQPWWLDAVATGRWSWSCSVVRRNGEIVAAWPYAFRTRLSRWTLIEMPPMTPYLGPWLSSTDAKYAQRLSDEKDLLSDLVAALPPFAVFDQDLHPACTNWLPMYWRGFSATPKCTYRIDAGASEADVWSGMLRNIRTDIRKAERSLTVVESADITGFVKLHEATFSRQNKPLPYEPAALRNLDAAAAARGCRRLLCAADSLGRVHSSVYLVWDTSTVYYLAGAGEPSLRNSGAGSLLLWKALQFALGRGYHFDFEGSMVENIERVFRAFGARQLPYLNVSKMNSRTLRAYRAAHRAIH